MIWSLIFLSIPLVTITYYLSYFAVAIMLRVHNKHYFLGFGGSLFEFKIRRVVFTVGSFIPIFGLSRFYKVENAARHRADHPWQFSDRPWLSRAFATYGGIIGVLALAIIILVAIHLLGEERSISKDEVNKYGIYPSSLAESYGFERGDKILTINGRPFDSFDQLLHAEVYQTAGNTFLVERAGEQTIIRVPEGNYDLAPGQPFLEIMVPFEIDSVLVNSPAEEIGLREGDGITAVNGRIVNKINDMRQQFAADDDGTVDLQIQRINGSDTVVLEREVRLDDRGNIGILTREPIRYTVKAISFMEAVRKGLENTIQLLQSQVVSTFGILGSEKKVKGGPINMSAAFGDDRHWEFFWYLTANFASFCVVWNIFPYPRSAFWEAIPLVYEGMTRRKYPYALFRGSLKLAWIIFWMVLLLTLVMDVSKLF